MTSFHDVIRARHSVRAFRPEPVADNVIRDVLADAQRAPSNCNTQPWETHIVSGAARHALSAALLDAFAHGRFSPDFSFDRKHYPGPSGERGDAQAADYFDALGIARENHGDRRLSAARNLTFFDAPHVALLFMPAVGDNVRVAGDIGMYGQTLLLSLVAHGLGGIPQTFPGLFAQDVRRTLGIADDRKLLFGISFGHPDPAVPIAAYRIGRVPLEETVRFHR
jgi:nitroreductase